MNRISTTITFGLLGFTLAAGSAHAQPVPLAMGDTVTPSGGTATTQLGSGYTVVRSAMDVVLSNNAGGTGATITEEVVRTSGGTYDFLFQEHNTGTNPLASVTFSDYSNRATSVGYLTDLPTGFTTPGTTFPTSAQRTPTPGGGITFNGFGGPAGSLAVGASTDVMVIATDATNANTLGGASTLAFDSSLGSTSAPVNSIYQPANAVPEPGSMLLMGTIAGLAGVRTWLRRRKTA